MFYYSWLLARRAEDKLRRSGELAVGRGAWVWSVRLLIE